MSEVNVTALFEWITDDAFRLKVRQRYKVPYEDELVRDAELTEDFMLFDGDTDHASVVWYRYNDNDELLARDHGDDPADIEVCRRHRDLAVAHAVPYAEFIRGVSLT